VERTGIRAMRSVESNALEHRTCSFLFVLSCIGILLIDTHYGRVTDRSVYAPVLHVRLLWPKGRVDQCSRYEIIVIPISKEKGCVGSTVFREPRAPGVRYVKGYA
jgi:hypothetical protein